MNFDFATAGRIVFGPGTLAQLGEIAKPLGRRALVFGGKGPSRAERAADLLKQAGLETRTFSVEGEPTFELVRTASAMATQEQCDVIVSIGGGSVIDAGKAVAMMLTNRGTPLDYAEVIGGGKPIEQPSAPFIAIPTTAGTGSEATRNAVLGSTEHRVKVSLRSALMLPRVALIDPELTYDLPPEVTASTGMDALSQLIEPFVSIRANPVTDALCREGIRRAGKSLARAFKNGHDAAARADLSVASLFSGMALANAGLGAVHGFAAPIGGMFNAPHGAICAALLPAVTLANVRALRARAADGEALRRYVEVARLMTNDPRATIEEGVRWLSEHGTMLGIPSLRTYGIRHHDLPGIVAKASGASSMKGNPIQLTADEMMGILQASI